jgi:hypothetical protein
MSTFTPSQKPWVVLVGGFLGAGKTTLILAAAKELNRRGLRCAVITNDQGEALVDSASVSESGLPHGEVTGGCFCCRFSKLMETIEELRLFSPDVIFAEPAGSCTDLSATTLHPLLEYSDRYNLAPFTVLVDPARAAHLAGDNAEDALSFLFSKQLEEADIVCLTKSDMGLPLPDLGLPSLRQLSARTGDGVAAWLDEVLSGALSCGSRILDIDYEQYANAEAALAWLNLQAELRPGTPCSSALLMGPLLDDLDLRLTTAGISICHLKLIMDSASGFLKAALCENGQEPVVEGALDASPAAKHKLLLNLRALGPAAQVREIVERAIERLPVEVDDLHISCFHPVAPQPERRIAMGV